MGMILVCLGWVLGIMGLLVCEGKKKGKGIGEEGCINVGMKMSQGRAANHHNVESERALKPWING